MEKKRLAYEIENNLLRIKSFDEKGRIIADEKISLSEVSDKCIKHAIDQHTFLECQYCANHNTKQGKCILEHAIERLTLLSSHDPLTGLHNRNFMQSQLVNLVTLEKKRVESKKQRGFRETNAILMIDIDYFKKYNDEKGHQAGDQILIQVSQLLKQNIKTNDWIARYGGEEFLIVLFDILPEDLIKICERLRTLVENNTPVTISIGASISDDWDLDGRTSDIIVNMISKSDEAAYAAKNEGRNTIVFINQPYNHKYNERKNNGGINEK